MTQREFIAVMILHDKLLGRVFAEPRIRRTISPLPQHKAGERGVRCQH